MLKNITPRRFQCGIGACPAIFESDRGTYLLVGRRMTGRVPVELRGHIGEDETVVEIPRELLALVHSDTGK